MSEENTCDNIEIVMSLNDMGDKKYKENKILEILQVICALLNTNGGILQISISGHTSDESTPTIGKYIRMIEQKIVEIVGAVEMSLLISLNFNDSTKTIVLRIKKCNSFTVVNYNLYIPIEIQVIQVPSITPSEMVKEVFMNEKRCTLPKIKLGSHKKHFVQGQSCDLRENMSTQFKNIKAAPSKCVTLADRICGKSNKLPCYISAFANKIGGHVYYGITEHGLVEGMFIDERYRIQEIERKVEKTIQNMIWSDDFNKPKKGVHWDIFFVQVKDSNANVLLSTYVIVIYIAAYAGAVFTEEPESYHLAGGKVERFKLAHWQSVLSLQSHSVSSSRVSPSLRRVTWSSCGTEKKCTRLSDKLLTFINNGNWDNFWRFSRRVESSSPDTETMLVVLSKNITAYYRTSRFSKAYAEIERFEETVSKSKDVAIFEVIGLYVKAALARCRGETENSQKMFHLALQKVDLIQSSLIAATVYSFGTALENPDTDTASTENSYICSMKALEHLQSLEGSTKMKTDLETKSHIYLALTYLGCTLTKQRFDDEINQESLAKANDHLKSVEETVFREGYPLTRFRQVQFELALSIQHYRRSQTENSGKCIYLLDHALLVLRRAQNLAKECDFDELVQYAQKCTAVYTAELVRKNCYRKSHVP